MHSIFALAQFEQGCFLSHLTFRFLHVMQERGFGAKGLPFCCVRSTAFAFEMNSSDMTAQVWKPSLYPQDGVCLKHRLLTERKSLCN